MHGIGWEKNMRLTNTFKIILHLLKYIGVWVRQSVMLTDKYMHHTYILVQLNYLNELVLCISKCHQNSRLNR